MLINRSNAAAFLLLFGMLHQTPIDPVAMGNKPVVGEEVASSLHDTLESIKSAASDVKPEERKEWLLKCVKQAGAQIAFNEELAEAVLYRVNLDALAQSFAMSFFAETSLGEDQWPIIETDSRDGRFNCRYISHPGRPGKMQIVDRRTTTPHLLDMYSTDEVEYPLMDLQIGNINRVDQVNRELAYELSQGLDGLARAMMDAGAKTSGLKSTIRFHKNIVQANIPDKNSYDFRNSQADDSGDGAGKDGKWTIEKFKRILDHFQRFSSDVEIDGAPLAPAVFYISTVNQRDIWDFCELVAGYNLSGATQNPLDTVPKSVRESIWTSGKLNDMFGVKFLLRTVNTIGAGHGYVSTNKPMGWYFHKPAFAKTWTEVNQRSNKGSVAIQRAHAYVAPDPWGYRYMKVRV